MASDAYYAPYPLRLLWDCPSHHPTPAAGDKDDDYNACERG